MQAEIVSAALKSANPNNKIGHARIGLFSTKLRGLEIELRDGSRLGAEDVEIKHGFLPKCLLFKKFSIENLKISKAFFAQKEDFSSAENFGEDESQESPAVSSTVQAPAKSPRKLGAAKEPAPKESPKEGSSFFGGFGLSVKNLEADIELRLKGGAKIAISLGGENPARNIECFDLFKLYSADLKFPATVEFGGEKFEARAQIHAKGTPKECKINAAASLGGKQIFALSVSPSDFYKKIEIKAQALANSRDFKSLADGLPQMSLNLASSASFDSDFCNADCSASMRADFENLREFSVYFDDLNSASAAAEISLSKRGGEISVKKFSAGLGINGSPAVSADCAKDFHIDISDISKFPDALLFSLNLNRFDPGLLNAFIKQNGFEVSAAPVSGTILVSKNGEKIEAESKNLIPIKNLSLSRGGSAVIQNASFNLFASGSTDFKKSSALLQISPIKNDSDFVGTVEFAMNSDSKTIRLQTGGNPSALFPRAKECGVEKAEASALVSIKGSDARLKNLEMNLSGKGGANILRAKSKNEIPLSLAGLSPDMPNAEFEIASEDLPMEILSALCPGASAEKIGFFASVKIGGGKKISSSISAGAKNFSYSSAEKIFAQNLDFELEGDADFSSPLLKVGVKKFTALENAAGILAASGSAVFGFDFSGPPVFKSGNLEARASIPKILQQPALKRFDNAPTGMLEINIAAESPEKIEASAVISNLSARGSADVLGKASLDVKASLKDFSPQKASAKFRMASTRGETLAAAQAEFSGEISAAIDAEKIVAEDLETLFGAFKNRLAIIDEKSGKTKYLRPEILKGAKSLPTSAQIRSSIKKKLLPHETQGAPEPEPAPAQAEAEPQIAAVEIAELPQPESPPAVWDFGKGANVKISARQILRGGEKMVENLSAEIFADKTSLKMPKASALFYGAPAEMNALVRFDGNLYSIKDTSVKIKELPVENLLEKNGENKTLVEGKFDVSADFFASGKTPEEALEKLRFNAEAQTRGGTLHFVDKTSDAWEMASAGAGLLKIGGAIFGGKVRDASDAAEALQLLADLDFSETKLKMSRGENLDIVLSPAEIKAQDAILKISGTLAYAEGEKLKNMPLTLPIKLDSPSGRLSQILQKIGYPKDESQTVSGPRFEITGTLSRPKNNIAEILAAAAKSVFKQKK